MESSLGPTPGMPVYKRTSSLGVLLGPEFCPGSGEVPETLPFPLDTSIMFFFLEFVIIIVFILRMKGLSLQVVTCLQS